MLRVYVCRCNLRPVRLPGWGFSKAMAKGQGMDYDDIILIGRVVLALALFLTVYGLALGYTRINQYRASNELDRKIRCIDVYAYGAEHARSKGCDQ